MGGETSKEAVQEMLLDICSSSAIDMSSSSVATGAAVQRNVITGSNNNFSNIRTNQTVELNLSSFQSAKQSATLTSDVRQKLDDKLSVKKGSVDFSSVTTNTRNSITEKLTQVIQSTDMLSCMTALTAEQENIFGGFGNTAKGVVFDQAASSLISCVQKSSNTNTLISKAAEELISESTVKASSFLMEIAVVLGAVAVIGIVLFLLIGRIRGAASAQR